MNTLEIISALKKYKVVPKLVGDHLKLVGETTSLPAELIEKVREKKEELNTFLREAMEQWAFTPIPAIPIQDNYSASNAQKRIWVLSQLDGGSYAYNIIRSFYLKGAVIKEFLENAFQLAIQRHESLRTVFSEIDGELRQIILEKLPFAIDFDDISSIDNPGEYLIAEVKGSSSWKFDLERGPLIKVKLYRLATAEYAMIFGVHHIISDGWSIAVMVSELMRAYEAYCKNESFLIDPLTIHYKEYSQWHAGRIESSKGQQARDFWKNQFPVIPDPLNLPADFQRSAMKSFEGAMTRYYPDTLLWGQILDFCKNNQVTSFNFLRATLTILLHRLSGQNDITIGTPVSGRNHLDLENQVGLYVNTLPLRASIDTQTSFLEFLKQLSDQSFRVFEFQDYPFDMIIEELQVQRDMSRNPLFDVMMVLQQGSTHEGSVNQRQQYGFELNLLDDFLYPSGRQEDEKIAVKLDLNFNFDFDPDNRFYIEIEYDTKLFKKERIGRFIASYIHIISEAMLSPDKPISAIELVGRYEKHRILHEFNFRVDEIADYSIIRLLDDSFWQKNERTALIVGDKTISYGELNDASDALAYKLTELLGSGQQFFVGLLMDRSEWTIISILGILKAGTAYVPIDIHYPASRIEYIIEDARLSFLLVDNKGAALVPPGYKGRVIHIEDIDTRNLQRQDPKILQKDLREDTAYLIYTSGSTGKPKGVEICHRNTIAFLKWAGKEFADTPFEILYATTSYCFDLSIFEFFFPLMQGKTIRMLRSATEIPSYAAKDDKIMLNTVPSVIRSLLQEEMDWQHIAALNMAGEPVPESFKKDLDFSAMEVRNLYGPSETTTYSTVYRFAGEKDSLIPIGKPIGYTQLYILDQHQNLQPIGVNGEIFLSGLTVAKGYFNQPALTAERFVNNPFLPGQLMYKTGDIGRWMENGEVEFIGRIDEQVKIRGYRVEPGEIRFRLEQNDLVNQAVVVVRDIGGENQLIAYIEGDKTVTGQMLREYLAGTLPVYMIPTYWVMLEKIPLNSNGKVDKNQLPLPAASMEPSSAIVPPETEDQKKLLSLWKQVLPDREFGITDNFFNRGGHSLKATRLRFLIAKEFAREITLNDVFAFPTIEGQAALLKNRLLSSAKLIPKTPHQDFYPISQAQERLWVLTKFEEASIAYNMPAIFKVKGPLDLEKFEEAFKMVIEGHEILRTVFTEKDGIPVQYILPPEEVSFNLETVAFDQPLPVPVALEWLKKKWRIPFDLAKGPLLNACIIQTTDGRFLSFNMHHIISDGWSLDILYKNVSEAYKLLLAGQPARLEWPEIQFKDYAVWQRTRLTKDELEEHRLFWNAIFKEQAPALELPTDFSRPEVKTYNGSSCQMLMSSPSYRKIHQLATLADTSVFMVLMAATRVLLKKYSGQQDILIGTVASGRDYHQLQDQIGFYVNTLPIRATLDPDASFLSMLRKEKETILAAFEHQIFSFEMLLEEVQIKRDLSRSPLFDVMLVLQEQDDLKTNAAGGSTPDMPLERISAATGIAKYDLLFSFSKQTDTLLLTMEYNTDLFREETMIRMARHLMKVFDQVTETPAVKIRDLRLPDENEFAILLSKADQSRIPYDHEATIISLFKRAAISNPDRIALVAGDKNISYRELDTRSGQLAKILMHEYAVLPEELVVLNFGRNEWMLIGILAVLKAGAAYVPVDPDYPLARMAYILEDCASRLVLYDELIREEITEKYQDRFFIDITALDYTGQPDSAEVRPANLAYVIYTSGTTGNPKGVLIEHQQVARLLFHDNNLFDFGHEDRWSLFHSYSFDFSVWEMYGALLNGGTLVMVPKEISQNSHAFYDFLQQEKITVLNQTPTAFRSLMQVNNARVSQRSTLQVRYLIFGGEALMPAILAEWKDALDTCRIVNMYGITETTVHVTYKEITKEEIIANRSNIGVPLPTVSCYVLDADLQQVPLGVVGELCVGGAGVARGYLNRPDLTAQKFIASPFYEGEKIYRSGDYARILSNGDIEYIGRKDDQVKIRGHRIEIAEVEDAFRRQQDIKDVVVLPLKNREGEYELAAWVIPAETFESPGHLRKKLRQLLPAYMVPSFIIPLDSLPLNNNGKLDKDALPGPEQIPEDQPVQVPLRNATDQQLLTIWEAVLEKKGISIKDNFFDLGGHSLKATRVVSKIHEIFGVKIDLKTLFIEPTIEHISDYIETVRWMEENKETITENQGEIIF